MAPVSTVIKVKFGDKLRRVNALIHKKEFNFDMAMLREKICSLFDFTPDVAFTLTYIDEDGDLVTLCDDDDLQDVASQCLNPLRITINLINTENLGRSSFTSCESFSPQDQFPSQFLTSEVLEMLKYNELSKLLLFLASETANCTEVLNELVEKLQKTRLNKPSECKEASKRSPATYLEALMMNEKKGLGEDEESRDSKNENVAKDVEFGELQSPRSLDLNVPYSGPENFPYLVDSKDVNGSFYDDCGAQVAVEADSVLKSKKDTEKISIESQQKSVGFGASNPNYLKRCLQDSEMTEISPYASPVPPFKRSYNHGNGLDSLIHTGVQCDGCGVYPITVPHFKSKVKDDYHLCKICFDETGLDHPTIARNSSPFKGSQDHLVSAPIPETKPSPSKLDSCFVLDINVYDGTIMAPLTTFTKIWRMRNNGGVVWPQGSQLLWTGGDWLSDTVSVEVEIPAEGLAVDEEVDIAVDFTAPELPGEYVSCWRMASPSGQKFGQRLWVYIQVDDDEISIDLNLPPVINPEVVKSGMGHDSEFHENHFARVVEPKDRFLNARDHVTSFSK